MDRAPTSTRPPTSPKVVVLAVANGVLAGVVAKWATTPVRESLAGVQVSAGCTSRRWRRWWSAGR